jgi:hypothetical protein
MRLPHQYSDESFDPHPSAQALGVKLTSDNPMPAQRFPPAPLFLPAKRDETK